jgi:hypothetical protein
VAGPRIADIWATAPTSLWRFMQRGSDRKACPAESIRSRGPAAAFTRISPRVGVDFDVTL